MKSMLLSITAMFMFAVGCVAEEAIVEGEDFDDVEAKFDGPAQPAGVYHLVEPFEFEEGAPRIGVLDLRSDGSFHDVEYGPVFDEGNFSEGQDEVFGTYKFTRDSHGNRYIRFKDDFHTDNTWRWRYSLSGTTLRFFYSSGEVGFRMKRAPRPTVAFVTQVQDRFATASRTTISVPTPVSAGLPESLGSRVRDLRIKAIAPITVFSYRVDDQKVFAIEYGPASEKQIEVFSKTSQLLAKSKRADPLTWATLKP